MDPACCPACSLVCLLTRVVFLVKQAYLCCACPLPRMPTSPPANLPACSHARPLIRPHIHTHCACSDPCGGSAAHVHQHQHVWSAQGTSTCLPDTSTWQKGGEEHCKLHSKPGPPHQPRIRMAAIDMHNNILRVAATSPGLLRQKLYPAGHRQDLSFSAILACFPQHLRTAPQAAAVSSQLEHTISLTMPALLCLALPPSL